MHVKSLLVIGALLSNISLALAAPHKVGVSLTMTGDAATFGMDMKNAITMAHEELGQGNYTLILEDDRCLGKDAVNVAHKFVEVDKVSYAIGFACNQVLLSAAPIYQKAGIPVISGFGTTGDVRGIGDKVFRLFPADHHAVETIYPYILARHKSLGIITEENEYPELIRRTFSRLHAAEPGRMTMHQETFQTGSSDLRPSLLRFKSKGVEALFINPNAEPSFIRIVQQLEQIRYAPTLYSVFWPSATVVQEQVGNKINGIIYANLPDTEKLLSPLGKSVLARYRKRFGEPNSVPYCVAFAYESFRLLDEAIKSGKPVDEYLRSARIEDGAIGTYSFDSDGAVHGLQYELQEYRDRLVRTVQ